MRENRGSTSTKRQGASLSAICRFNGATAFRRWKDRLRLLPLQWGHRLSAMETLRILGAVANGATAFRHGNTPGQRPASMGPPPFGDGNLRCNIVAGFNPPFGDDPSRADVASMGPPPFGDGNVRFHGLSPALSDVASMGPPPFGDGDTVSAHLAGTSNIGGGGFNGATAFRRWRYPGSAVLQRLPPFGDGNWHLVHAAKGTCFNGATAFRRWKHGTGTFYDAAANRDRLSRYRPGRY